MFKKMVFLFTLIMSFNLLATDKGEAVLTFDGHEAKKEKVDILFVLDNSGSMHNHKEVIKPKILNILKTLDARANWRAGFMTSDFYDARHGKYIGLEGRINSKLENRHLEVLSALNTLWHLSGGAEEQLLDSTYHALTKERGFFREDAQFVMVYVTDEDDQSALLVEDYISIFNSNFNRKPSLRLIAKKENDTCPAGTWLDEPEKLMKLVQKTQGRLFGICSDFSDDLATSIASSVKIDLGVTLPSKYGVKIFINEKEVKTFSINDDLKTLFIHNLKELTDTSKIKVIFNI